MSSAPSPDLLRAESKQVADECFRHLDAVRPNDRNGERLSENYRGPTTSCTSITRSRFCAGSFRFRKVRFGRLARSCEVAPKRRCHFCTTVRNFPTASRRGDRAGPVRSAHVPDDRDCPRGAHGRRRSRGCLCPGAAVSDVDSCSASSAAFSPTPPSDESRRRVHLFAQRAGSVARLQPKSARERSTVCGRCEGRLLLA